MKRFQTLFIALLILCGFSQSSCSQNTPALKVVLIRHGEKPDEGDNLTCQGLNRSMQLPKVLYAKFGLPSAIFVPSPGVGKRTKYARMYQTIVPFAVKYNLAINSAYTEEDYKSLVKDVETRTGTVFVVWEHNGIEALAAQFGYKKQLKWPADDFDSIWILTIKNGDVQLTQDKEGITPSPNCAF